MLGNLTEPDAGEEAGPMFYRFSPSFSAPEMGVFHRSRSAEPLFCEKWPGRRVTAAQTGKRKCTIAESSIRTSSYYPPSSMG